MDSVGSVGFSPMSFSEFVHSLQVDLNSFDPEEMKAEKLLQHYIKFGGLPVVSYSSDKRVLEKMLVGIFYETFLKEIVFKRSMRNYPVFFTFLKFLAANIGKPVKLAAIEEYCSKSNTPITIFSIENYLSLVTETPFFKKVLRYDIKSGSFINGGECFYCADTGLANAMLNFENFDETALMKNVVYLEFLRRGYDVYSARVGTMTTDFLATIDDDIVCVQVLPADGSKKPGQLLRPLHKLPDQIDKFLISKYPVKLRSSVKNLTLSDFLFNDNFSSPPYNKRGG